MGNYQPMGNVYDGKLGRAVLNSYDSFGVHDSFGATAAPVTSPAVAAAEREVADASVEIARISGQIGSNPAKAAELPAVQERLTAAADKLAKLRMAEIKAAKGGSLLPLLLVTAAAIGGFLYWRSR